MEVNITKRIDTLDGRRFAKVIFAPNGRIKPDWVKVDERQEKIGYKIREAQLQKVPYMLFIGDRESAEGTVSVRTRTGGDQGASSIDAFIASAREEIARKGI